MKLQRLRGTINLRSRRNDGVNVLPTSSQENGSQFKKPRTSPLSKLNWKKFLKTGNPALIFLLNCVFAMLLLSMQNVGPELANTSFRTLAQLSKTGETMTGKELPLLLPVFHSFSPGFTGTLQQLPNMDNLEKDFGGLEISKKQNDMKKMVAIRETYYEDAEHQREKLLEVDEGEKENYYQPIGGKEDEASECHTPGWVHYTYPSCNLAHEKLIERKNDQSFRVTYLE